MNEKKFMKQLNSKNNLEGTFTYLNVCELLDKSSIILHKKQNIFEKIFKKYRKVDDPQQIISNNLETILDKTQTEYLHTLIIKLIETPETQDIVMKKFDVILKKISDSAKEKNNTKIPYENMPISTWQLNEILNSLKKANPEILISNIDNILNDIPAEQYLFQIAQALKGISSNIDEKLNNNMEKNKIGIAKSLLKEALETRNEKNNNWERNLEDFSLTLSIMIDELLESENARFVDIKQIGRGSYSNVYQIGSKVLKIGEPRETYKIPNHNRILQPLTRTNFVDEKDNNKLFACIEISDKVDKLIRKEIDEEKLYEVYKELRNDGIIWTDVRFDNVGKLTKENIPSLNGEYINVSPNSVGFESDKSENSLGIGDWVILDTDYIYKQENNDIIWQDKGFAKKFEKRWQQEIANKIAKDYKKEHNNEEKNERAHTETHDEK